MLLRLVGALMAVVLCACSPPPDRTVELSPQAVAWRSLGSWSGRGNAQIDSFTSDTGALRVRWETSNETSPGAGTFRVTIHSAISGRALAEAVFHRGVGSDTAYVQEDPRVFYAVVESASVDWTFTVEEAVSAPGGGAGRAE